MKKFNSVWYSIEDIRWVNKERRYVSDKNGYLYSNAKYNTKIKSEDLPEWYIYGRYYKRFGYLSAKGVVDVYYIPNKIFNHYLKYDDMFISYTGKIDKTTKDILEVASQKDLYHVYGLEILYMLKGIKKYSNYDISEIIEQLKDKMQWFKENHPKDFEHECGDFDLDKFFND